MKQQLSRPQDIWIQMPAWKQASKIQFSTELLSQASIQDWKEQDCSCTSALCVGQAPSIAQWRTASMCLWQNMGAKAQVTRCVLPWLN